MLMYSSDFKGTKSVDLMYPHIVKYMHVYMYIKLLLEMKVQTSTAAR